MSLNHHFTTVTYIYLVVFLIHYIWEYALDILNIRWMKRRRSQPPPAMLQMTSSVYPKSIDYSIDNIRLSMIDSIPDMVITWFFIIFGFSQLDIWVRYKTSNEYLAGLLFIGFYLLASYMIHLPAHIYHDFVLEHKYGFNKKNLWIFVTDMVKSFGVSIILGAPLLSMLFYFMNSTGDYWWIAASLLIIAFQFFVAWIYPVLIAPLFNKFNPLEGNLRAAVETTARKAGITLKGIFTMDGSRRSRHSNAYFTGLGRSKRIVFFDTLLNKISIDQAMGVLAHEMGHYRLGHVKKKMFLSSILVILFLKGMAMLKEMPVFYSSFGFDQPSSYAVLIIFSLLVGTFMFPLQFLFNALSRRFEFEADRFAVKINGSAEPLINALLILHEENLSSPTTHPLYAAYHYSHPLLMERIEAIKSYHQLTDRKSQP